jgi:hypothetical protein
MAKADGDLKRRFWIRLWMSALVRIETAAVVAGTVLALAASRLPPFSDRVPDYAGSAILVFGCAAVLWLTLEGLYDAARQGHAVRDVLIDRIDIESLEDATLRSTVERAFEIRRRIIELGTRRRGEDGGPEVDISAQLDGWLGHFLKLARRLDALHRELAFANERAMSDEVRIAALEAELRSGSDTRMGSEIERTLVGYRRNLALAREIGTVVGRAALKIEQSVNLISSVHGQLVLAGAARLEGGAAERLRAEIAADAAELDRLTAAVRDVEVPRLEDQVRGDGDQSDTGCI